MYVVKGHYVWYKDNHGRFLTKFFPTSDYTQIRKYFEEHEELEYISNYCEVKTFNDSEMDNLIKLMIELNNL